MGVLKNARHEAFAQSVAKGKTADEAYVEAGFKANRGNASRLKSNENIMKRVAELVGAGAERAEIDVARVLRELARVGLSDIRKLFTDAGHLRSIADLDDDTAAALASVEVVSRPGEADENGDRSIEYVHKVRLWDKNSALEKLGKHLGMFVDRHEVSGPDGGPIQHEDVTADADAFASRLSGLAARTAAARGTGETDTGNKGGA